MRNWSAILIDAGLNRKTYVEVAREQGCGRVSDVRNAARRYGVALELTIAPKGTRSARVIGALRELGCAPLADIEAATGLQRADVSNILKSLERRGVTEVAGTIKRRGSTSMKVWRLAAIERAA